MGYEWAWTGRAAAAVMDLGRQGVGGGTVAATVAHLYRHIQASFHARNSCGLAASNALSVNLEITGLTILARGSS